MTDEGDSYKDLLAKMRAQRAQSKSGVLAMKKTRYESQQRLQRTQRTLNVLDRLRAEDDASAEGSGS